MQKAPSTSQFFVPYYSLIVAAGLGLLLLVSPALNLDRWPILALWLVLTAVTDASRITLRTGGYITVAPTLDYAGILIFGPVATAWVELISTFAVGLALKRPLRRTIFNAAVMVLTILTAGAVYRALGGPVDHLPRMPGDLVPLAALGVTYLLVNTVSVSIVIALSEGQSVWRIWRTNLPRTATHMLGTMLGGLAIAIAYGAVHLWGVLIFVTPLLLATYAFGLYDGMKQDIFSFIAALSGVIDQVDPYTHQHTWNVKEYSIQIGRAMNLPEGDVETIEFAALLHDLGKIKQEYRDLVLRPTRLSEREKEFLADHAIVGAGMAAKIRALQKARAIILAHHERMDGTGYPNRIKGEEIPLGARIVCVADAFDAMTTDRIYQAARTVPQAIEILKSESGRQFDPRVVECLDRLVRSGQLIWPGPVPPPAPIPGTMPRAEAPVALAPAVAPVAVASPPALAPASPAPEAVPVSLSPAN